ncbi:hypothetical protein EG68_08908 [Paragonimus skrjabini miyazakii]|uniref:Helicase-associated domain-containing protein n=1 Tax=Paragonimus skrjabini miyazakii TaxID=59628 RepID=A0A8S9YM89_9TREM|nr:hypothetical protein EG68_08908 [Paragonimus skrjabini miyazakii]
MSPPDQKAVERTLHFLHEIQALSLSDGTFGKDHEHLSRQQRKLTARQLRKQRKQMARNATKNANIIVISDDDDGGKDANSQPEPLPSKSSYVGLPGDNAPLSPLGEHLARLPMNPQLAKLLILGALFGCLEPALAVASCLNYRDPFEIPLDRQISAAKGRLGLSQNTLSDHWVYVTVVQNFRQLTSGVERYRFCQEYFIRDNVVSEIIRLMGDYARLLHEYRYIATPSPTDPGANINMNNFPLFRAILCGALFPNILKLVPQIKDGRVCRPKVHARPSEGDISINPKSVNGNVWPADPVWMVYFAKTRMDNSTCSTVLDTTIIPLRPVLFFSGSIQSNLIDSTVFTVDNWIKVQANPVLFRLIRDLRACLDDILESKFRCPSVTNWDPSSAEGRVLHTVVNLLANELVPTVQTQRYPWEPKTLERPSGGDGVQSSQSKLTAPHLDNQKQDV